MPGLLSISTTFDSRSLVGTLAYMAPEQVQGKQVTTQTDIYALGVTMYEMTTGELPFVAESAIEAASLRLGVDPRAPSEIARGLDPRLEAVILKCLAREPEHRFTAVEEVASALRRTMPQMPRVMQAKPAPTSNPPSPPPAMPLWKLWPVAAGTAFLAGALVVAALMRKDAAAPVAPAANSTTAVERALPPAPAPGCGARGTGALAACDGIPARGGRSTRSGAEDHHADVRGHEARRGATRAARAQAKRRGRRGASGRKRRDSPARTARGRAHRHPRCRIVSPASPFDRSRERLHPAMTRGGSALLLAALALALAPPGAIAQTAPAPAPAPAGAPAPPLDDRVRQAAEAYDRGEFDRALELLQAAYAETSKPALLFNMAQVQRSKSDCATAAATYRRFLDTTTSDDPNRQRAQRYESDMLACAARAKHAAGT